MKKLLSVFLLSVLLLTLCLPFAANAETSVSLANISGEVFPGCEFTVGVLASGKDISYLTGNPISYDANQISPVGEPTTRISNWQYSAGKANFIAGISSMDAEGVSGNNLELVRFTFRLKDSVQSGDTITLEIHNTNIVAQENFSGNLSCTIPVVKNSNANLMGLTCKDQNDNNCTFSPAFSSSVTSYSMTVDNKVTSLKITPQTANDKAVAEVSGASDLQVGENTVVIKVTADSGNTKEYILKVTRKEPPSVNALLEALSVAEGTLSPAFDPNTTEYTLSVPADKSSLSLGVTTADSKATYQITGNEAFRKEGNAVSITVTAEDGKSKTTYTITVTREEPVFAAIELSEGTLTPEFDPSVTEYTLEVPAEILSLSSLQATPKDSAAQYTVEGNEEFIVGENVVLLKLTSEDGLVDRIYTLRVQRARPIRSDSALSSLTCSYGALSPAFSPENTTYVLLTDTNPGAISLTAAPRDEFASASSSTFIPRTGMNIETIECSAEDGTITTYTVYVFVPAKEYAPAVLITGSPAEGQALSAKVLNLDTAQGTYTWYLNDQPVSGANGQSFTVPAGSEEKTLKVRFVSAENKEYFSDGVLVQENPAILSPGETQVGMNTATLVITICVVLVALGLGILFGIFFTKRNYS